MIARILTFVAITCCATSAFAHAFLQHAEPGAGATFKIAPSRVVLSFSEKLQPVLSGVSVTNLAGRNVAAGAVAIRGNSMLVPLSSLAAGTYRVVWHVVSADAHRMEGAYSFAVKP